MLLVPIDIDEARNTRFQNNAECAGILKVYPGFYQKVGYNVPWIGYFATLDEREMVGCGGYKGSPRAGKVEIAYGTFKKFEGKGIGTEICRQLVVLALQTDPAIRITARTLPGNGASQEILKRNGFVCNGLVFDEEDGDVLEWTFKNAEFIQPDKNSAIIKM